MFLTIASIVVNVVLSGVIIWITVKNHRHTTELAREQLELARAEAASVPKIELMEVYFAPINEAPELVEEIDDARKNLARRRKEDEEDKAYRNNPNRYKIHPSVIRGPRFNMPVHEGPWPDRFLDVKIKNVGSVAAYHVMGWIEVDDSVVEPVEFFFDTDVEVKERTGKGVILQLAVSDTDGRILPSHYASYSFRVPVKLHKVEDTAIDFEFNNAEGDPGHGTFNLRLASSREE